MQALDLNALNSTKNEEPKDLSCSEKEPDIFLAALCEAKRNGVTSSLSSSSGEPPQLHGFKPPQFYIQQEKYEHRIVAHLKAEGKTNIEIAEITGFTAARIGYIVKQPWVNEMILEIIHQRGGDKVELFLNEMVMPALEVFKGVIENKDESTKNKLAAANAILDRKFGKPNQALSITHSQKESNQLTDAELHDLAERGRVTASTATSS